MLDEDGSITGFGVRSALASAADNGMWWNIDDETILYDEGPLWMFRLDTGAERGLGHVRLQFDPSEHAQVSGSVCSNGGMEPCPPLGYVKHLGPRFADDAGLPVTAQADIAGPVGGFGWFLELNGGSPKKLKIELIEVAPDTPLMLLIPYPPGTTFEIFAFGPYGCDNGCYEFFTQVESREDVRRSAGNTYHFSSEGLLSMRVAQFAGDWFGDDGQWILPNYETTYPWDDQSFVLDRFERGGVRLPRMQYGPYIQLSASCSGGTYCDHTPPTLYPSPCPSGFVQVAFDKCCATDSECVCANGESCSVATSDVSKMFCHQYSLFYGSGLAVAMTMAVILDWI